MEGKRKRGCEEQRKGMSVNRGGRLGEQKGKRNIDWEGEEEKEQKKRRV